jgi:hypothetical protein
MLQPRCAPCRVTHGGGAGAVAASAAIRLCYAARVGRRRCVTRGIMTRGIRLSWYPKTVAGTLRYTVCTAFEVALFNARQSSRPHSAPQPAQHANLIQLRSVPCGDTAEPDVAVLCAFQHHVVSCSTAPTIKLTLELVPKTTRCA